MKLSWRWLNEYVDLTEVTPEAVAEALTNSGLEVESIETLGGSFSGVVVGKIDAVSPHPNADRLRLVTVNLGPLGKNQVVCGAPNVETGMWIAYAQIGAHVINRKEGSLFELKPAVIRGVESSGMICSLAELALEDAYPSDAAIDGIWPLAPYVNEKNIGQDLKEALGLETDVILDVTPNANRGDLMSVIGVAREVAALFNLSEKPANNQQTKLSASSTQSTYKIKLDDPSVCTYYTGAILKNVKISESPAWMKARLTAAGVKTINNVVDITNYVMLEMGQPLHAFDIGKLGSTGTVGVRYAKPGDILKTLDDEDHTLTAESVVVTFNEQPVALAGVMGGESTKIDDNTQAVFLEAAYFPPATNRKSARSVGIRTESSARFERGIDRGAVETAFLRAIALYEELAGATWIEASEADHRQLKPFAISLSHTRMTRILGLEVPLADCTRILKQLGFEVSASGDAIETKVPTFREQDVTRDIDLIEEIIRIYGYDKIPYTLPQNSAAANRTLRQRLIAEVRQTLSSSGLSEAMTLSLIGDSLLEKTGFSQDPNTTVRVTNSHSIEHTFLRQSTLPTLLDVAKNNQDQGNETVWLFELGRTYFKTKPATERESGVDEKLMLSALVMGNPDCGSWQATRPTDFYTLKGILENLLSAIGISQSLRWTSETHLSALHPGQTASIKLGKQPLGFCGRLHPGLEKRLKFKLPVYVFEIDMEVLYQILLKQPESKRSHTLSPYQPVKRDMAFLAPLEVTHQKIMSAVSQLQDPLLKQIELFDEYRGAQVAEGQRSLAYRMTMQSATSTLTDKEIEETLDKIKRQLASQLPISFR